MTRFPALLLLALAVSTACAQPRQPTGGPPVDSAPRVVQVSPEPFTVITDLRKPVIIEFDERLSERLEGVRDWNDAVIVSPQTGDVRVRRGRRHVEISMAGGWQPGLVYRVELLPVIRDLFNNVRREPVELIFSTGATIMETALAGFVEDRITGRPVRGARISATHTDHDLTYVALTDSAGFFALRHIPEGPYEVAGWVDQNRNARLDLFEPHDATALRLAAADTAVVELRLLPGDTTPARLLRASVIDPTKVELGFDDYFEPGPVPGTAQVFLAADSTFVTEGELFHATRLDSLMQAERAAAAEAEAVADTAAVPAAVPDREVQAEQPPARPGPGREARPTASPARQPLPARDLILLLPEPLEPATNYYVVVTGVTNIHGLTGGGGTASFRTPAEERPPVPDPDPEG
jgi:hypothetical protein